MHRDNSSWCQCEMAWSSLARLMCHLNCHQRYRHQTFKILGVVLLGQDSTSAIYMAQSTRLYTSSGEAFMTIYYHFRITP